MGYNSVILICNDAMHAIDENPAEWWEQAKQALYIARDKPVHFTFNNYFGYFQAIRNEHADTTSVIAVGGNTSTILLNVYNGGRHHTEESQISLIKLIADQLGYKLIKKPKAIGKKKQLDLT